MTDQYTKLYIILGVAVEAGQEEIKQAYRSMAQRHHPDKGGDKEHFQAIQEAYEVLSDPARRARYDREGTYRHQHEPTREDRVNVAANNVLMNVMAAIIDNTENVEYTNIFDNLTAEVEKLKARTQDEHDTLAKRIEKFEKSVKRIKAKEGGDNVAALLLQSVVGKLHSEMDQAKFNIDIGNRIVEVVNAHTYDVDEMPEDMQNERRRKDADALREMINRQFGQFGRF